jgi:hypothetical protein
MMLFFVQISSLLFHLSSFPGQKSYIGDILHYVTYLLLILLHQFVFFCYIYFV